LILALFLLVFLSGVSIWCSFEGDSDFVDDADETSDEDEVNRFSIKRLFQFIFLKCIFHLFYKKTVNLLLTIKNHYVVVFLFSIKLSLLQLLLMLLLLPLRLEFWRLVEQIIVTWIIWVFLICDTDIRRKSIDCVNLWPFTIYLNK
jgi:hypothetical protein